jgi:hypothetical protein
LINYIKIRLFDEKLRSYSYYVSVPCNKKDWNIVYDSREYQSRIWQLIYFPQITVKYIKIVGTECHDTIECNYFEVSSIEIFRKENPMHMENGILCPNQDMAKEYCGAKLMRGINTWILEDRSVNIDRNSTKNFTYHKPYGDILIQLSQIIHVNCMKLVTWAEVQYEFTISLSTDNENWDVIYEYDDEPSQIFEHMIRFEARPVLFIKIFGENVGENDDTDDTFRIVSFECPAV